MKPHFVNFFKIDKYVNELLVFGRPFVKPFALCYQTVVCLSCPVCLFVTFVHCGQTVGRIKMKLGMQVGLSPGHIVLDGTQLPLPQRATALPQFSAHVCCGEMAAWIKMALGVELGLGPVDFVLDGNPAPLLKRGGAPQKISAHLSCGQTAGWMKLVLGMEVGLIPGHFVLYGDPAPPPKGGGAPFPIFGPFILWPNGSMHLVWM